MKAESNIMPQKAFVVDRIGEQAYITFFTDVQPFEIRRENEIVTEFKYNSYTMTVSYRNDIETVIENSLQLWLDTAKKNELKNSAIEPTDKERLEVLEQAMLEIILGGTI